jgi:hypothetical protein
MFVVALVQLSKMFAYHAHAQGKGFDVVEQARILEILHHFVTKGHGIDIVQWHIEEGCQVVFLFAGCNRCDDLIEIEIGKEVARFSCFWLCAVFRSFEQDAVERHGANLERSRRMEKKSRRIARRCYWRLLRWS